MTEQLLETSVLPVINDHPNTNKAEQASHEAAGKQKDDINSIDCMLGF